MVVGMYKFDFIDLFAGIGGMRIAADSNGGKCVFTSEINPQAAYTYKMNFNETPHGDITKIKPHTIPDHDLLLGGFPCQPFSSAGLQKGFKDPRGNLFFNIRNIAYSRQPNCLVLENVKQFMYHDNGRTAKVVLNSLRDIGYDVSCKILNASDFGLAQNRERVIIVASRLGRFNFNYVREENYRVTMNDVIDNDGDLLHPKTYTLLDRLHRTEKGLIFAGFLNGKTKRNNHRPNHSSQAHRATNKVYDIRGLHPTLIAQDNGRRYVRSKGIVRKLSVPDAYKLQGFPDDFKIHPTFTHATWQVGNTVPVPMIEAVIRSAYKQGLIVKRNYRVNRMDYHHGRHVLQKD